MKIVKNEVVDYLSINVTQDEVVWDALASYAFGDIVRVGNFLYTFASKIKTNTTQSPDIEYEQNKSTFSIWQSKKPTNYYAMLDGETRTQTENSDEIIFELANDRYDSFALLGLDATFVMIELVDTITAEVYITEEFDLIDRTNRIDAYTHYFLPIELKRSVYYNQISLLPSTKLKVTIRKTGSIAKCGRLVFGNSYNLGFTLYGLTLGFQSNSRFNTNSFGETELLQVSSLPVETYPVRVPTSKASSIKQKRAEWDAVPLLFIGDETENSNVDNLLVFGYFSKWDMTINTPTISNCSMTIKGLL